MMKTKMMTHGVAIFLGICFLGVQPAFCNTVPDMEKRVKALEQDAVSRKTGLQAITDRITLSGAIELDASYADDSDVSDKTQNDATSDLAIGTIELGLEASLHEYVTANILLKGEDLDSNGGDKIFWDEVFFTFQKKDMPVYFIGGKRTQPFGNFESLFINDPITQDLYEINKTGATIGFANDVYLGLDLSLTFYKGETIADRIDDAGFGWERNTSAGYAATNDISSYILSASFAPVEGMQISTYYNSESGDSNRNTTLGGSVHWEITNFIADAEYIGALEREKHVADNREYDESAWFVSLGYQVMPPLVIAVRYENFDSDKKNDGNLDCRYSIGATYTLFETDAFACNLMGEARRLEYETLANTTVDSEANELFARIALEF